MAKEDNSILFGVGLLTGILGGILGAVLYAPKSGKETREELKKSITTLAQKHAPEIKKAKKQALCSIDMMRYKLEKRYNELNNMLKAKQLAKAKELETCDYDFN